MPKPGVLIGVLLVVFLGSSSFALGATKVLEIREQNVSRAVPLPVIVVCGGIFTNVVLTLTIRELSVVLWDDGHSEVTFKGTNTVVDSSGGRIAQTQEEMITVTGTGGLPLSFEHHLVGTCGGASPNPGLMSQFIMGFTIGEDGTLKETHFHLGP